MVYMTVLPQPTGPNATSQPVSSSGIHLTVKSFAKSNPGGVLPVAIGTPVALMLIAIVPIVRRRRAKDQSASGRELTPPTSQPLFPPALPRRGSPDAHCSCSSLTRRRFT